MGRKFVVNSACCGRILNDLNRQGVPVQCVQTAKREVCFVVADKCSKKVCRCLDDKGYVFCMQRRGLAAFGAFLAGHLALWIALALVAVSLAVCSRFVWRVRIDCVDELYQSVQQRVMADEPIGKWSASLDLAALKEELVAIDGVALVSVYCKGVCLVVEVKEELPPALVQEPRYAPIVATCDCIVSRVVVERGRALVEAGQSVRKGDVLIAPEYLLDKDQDIAVPTEAIGTVYGYVYLAAETTYDEYGVVLCETGNAYSAAYLTIAGRQIGETPTSPYATYQYRRQIFAWQNWLPISLTRITYREQREQQTYRPWQSAKEEVEAYLGQQIEAQLKNNVKILRKWCIINNTGSTYYIRAYAEVEQEVGD